MSQSILVVDDDRATCKLVSMGLRAEGFSVRAVTSGEEALRILAEDEFGVVVTDLSMPGMDGLKLCAQISSAYPDLPVVVMTAFASLERAIGAMRTGAYDFITKPFDVDVLILGIRRALRHHELKSEVKRLRAAVGQAGWGDDMLGTSPAMIELRSLLERMAETDATVLITGESGTGKEVVARVLHSRGRRPSGPFVAFNCAAMPETLIESELFGHTRGAFTDARTARSGLLLEANGGTLLLDEIGDMPLGIQPKLLRALETRTVRPVGGGPEARFDARIIVSTNRDLETAVEDGRFRQDLYYRINVLSVHLPPLRACGGDVLLLAQHFVEHFAGPANKPVHGITTAAAERLLAYPWPGNVRELRNSIERAVALTRYDAIAADDLPAKVRQYDGRRRVVVAEDPGEILPLEEVERRYILGVLEAVRGNRSLAAQKLGMNRKTLYRRLSEYGARFD